MIRSLLFITMITPLLLNGQNGVFIDSRFNDFVHSAVIMSNNQLIASPVEKGDQDLPYSIEVTYEGSECNSRLNSIHVNNCQFPLFWYALNASGEKGDPLINPKPSQLQDHTTYVVEDFHFHSDTVYIDFTKSFEFHGLYPNPTPGQPVLNYKAFKNLPVSMSLFDVYGKLVYSGNSVFEEGHSELLLDIRDFKPGTYFLTIQCECINETIKLIHTGL